MQHPPNIRIHYEYMNMSHGGIKSFLTNDKEKY
jgi:hypothetical protein